VTRQKRQSQERRSLRLATPVPVIEYSLTVPEKAGRCEVSTNSTRIELRHRHAETTRSAI